MKIAIIRLSSFGDIVITAVFLELLKSRIKNLHITWIVDSSFKSILENSPYIDNICDIPLRKSKKEKRIIFDVLKKIRNLEKFDLVLDFQGLLKSAIIGKLLKTNEFIGYSKSGMREKIGSIFYTKTANIDYKEHILKRQYAILQTAFEELFKDDFNLEMLDYRAFGIKSSSIAKEDISKLLDKNAKKHILFVLEASKAEKEYPLDSFYNVAMGLKAIYRDIKIYLIWDNKENEIKNLGNRDLVFSALKHLNIDEIKSLIANMNLVIGGDTGITHLAWALCVPAITLYGNTPMDRFKLEGKNYISITQNFKNKIIKGDFSIQEINPNIIIDATRKIL